MGDHSQAARAGYGARKRASSPMRQTFRQTTLGVDLVIDSAFEPTQVRPYIQKACRSAARDGPRDDGRHRAHYQPAKHVEYKYVRPRVKYSAPNRSAAASPCALWHGCIDDLECAFQPARRHIRIGENIKPDAPSPRPTHFLLQPKLFAVGRAALDGIRHPAAGPACRPAASRASSRPRCVSLTPPRIAR